MAGYFLDNRKQIKAEELTGPRVYSTDLLPAHFDRNDPNESVAVTARAFKIKILTKGLVTLNSTYLVSPLAVKLVDAYPDMFNGPSILPAFRIDKGNLSDLVESTGGHSQAGISDIQLREHIEKIEGQIKQVMPWNPAGIGDTLRNSIVNELKSANSLIRIKLVARGIDRNEMDRIADHINVLDFSDSKYVREYIATLPETVREPLKKFITATYHRIGTGVVKCETGTDLSPLSELKAADLLLTARDSREEQLELSPNLGDGMTG